MLFRSLQIRLRLRFFLSVHDPGIVPELFHHPVLPFRRGPALDGFFLFPGTGAELVPVRALDKLPHHPVRMDGFPFHLQPAFFSLDLEKRGAVGILGGGEHGLKILKNSCQ